MEETRLYCEEIEFDQDNHAYFVGGHQIPNVTKALNLFAERYAGIPRYAMDLARFRGQAVHLATVHDDQGKLDYDYLDDQLKPYIDAWRKFKEEAKFKPMIFEMKVYHEKYKYAGTLDRIGRLGDFKQILLDIKTGAAMTPITGPQTAAYLAAYAIYKRIDITPIQRYGVELHNNGTFKLQRFDDPEDLAVFLASLTLLRWRHKHNYWT